MANGDIVTVNAGGAHIVELTAGGVQLSFVDVSNSKNGSGTLFGPAMAPSGAGVYYVERRQQYIKSAPLVS